MESSVRDWLIVNYRAENGRSPDHWCRKCGGKGELVLVDVEFPVLVRWIECPTCLGRCLSEIDELRDGWGHINPLPKRMGRIRGRAYKSVGLMESDFVTGEFECKEYLSGDAQPSTPLGMSGVEEKSSEEPTDGTKR